jgi:hypothetical protein
MTTLSIHLRRTLLPAAVLAAAFLSAPSMASAQRAQSRLTPLIAHPSAEPIGPSLRLRDERLDLSTITREDTSLQVGRELAQGETVTTVRRQRATPDPVRERRQQVIRDLDNISHKRLTILANDD